MKCLIRLLFLFGVLGVGGSVLAQTKIRVGYLPIAEETPKFVASKLGIFNKHGLDAEMVRFESGPDMGTALIGGSIQFGMIGTPGLIFAASAGRPLVAINDNGTNKMGPAGLEYYTGLIVLDGSPIKDIGDLKNKKIAMNVLKANSEAQTVMQVQRWNRENPSRAIHLDKDVQIITIPLGSMQTALEKGFVDAASLLEPFTAQIMMSRKIRVIAPVEYALPRWPVSFGILRRDYAERNANVLREYLAAWNESVRWIRANPESARSIMQQFTGVPSEAASRIVMPEWTDDIDTARENARKVMEMMVAARMIPKEVDLRQVIIGDLK